MSLVEQATSVASVAAATVADYALEAFSHVTPLRTLLAVAGVLLAYGLYAIFWRPLIIDKTVSTQELYESEIRKRKNIPDMQPPYPNAWYKIADAWELAPGQLKKVTLCGQEMVVFRCAGDETGKDRGKVAVLDAYCPHLGANLAVGGKVVGNCIQCPFHGWEFGKDGTCEHIPYNPADCKPPSNARVKPWPVMERNGMIWVWYDIEGKPPAWEIPAIPAIENRRARWHGRTSNQVMCHVSEIPENGPDTAHLAFLHSDFIIPGLTFFSHTWNADWVPLKEPNHHLAVMNLQQQIAFLGKGIPGTKVQVNIMQCGPTCVQLNFLTPMGTIYVIETLAPISPFLVQAYNCVWADACVPRFMAKAVLKSLTIQFERDIPIWNHKNAVRAPLAVKGDGPLLLFRRWYKQFYSQDREKYAKAFDW